MINEHSRRNLGKLIVNRGVVGIRWGKAGVVGWRLRDESGRGKRGGGIDEVLSQSSLDLFDFTTDPFGESWK